MLTIWVLIIKQVLGPCSCVFVDYNRQKAKVGFVYQANIKYINICIFFSSKNCHSLHLFVLETPIKIWEKNVPLSQGLPDI